MLSKHASKSLSCHLLTLVGIHKVTNNFIEISRKPYCFIIMIVDCLARATLPGSSMLVNPGMHLGFAIVGVRGYLKGAVEAVANGLISHETH